MARNGLTKEIRQVLDSEGRLSPSVQSPFQRLAQQWQDILGDGGILKEVIQAGDGEPIPMDASVLIHYSGYVEYSHRPFETSNHLKHPQMMKLGRDVWLPGLELGLRTMKKGEFSRFLFLPKYAYGAMGRPPFVPPSATLLYEVQVLDFLDSAEVDKFFALSVEEQNAVPLSTMVNVVDTERSFGNHCFRQRRYRDAKKRYKKAVSILRNRTSADESERERIVAMKLPIFLNLSVTFLRLNKPVKALEYGQKVLALDPQNTKALFRCGQACLELGDYDKSEHFLVMAQAQKPFNTDINMLLKKLAISLKDSVDKEKVLYQKMMADFKAK